MAYFPSPYTCFGTLKFHPQGFVVCYKLFFNLILSKQFVTKGHFKLCPKKWIKQSQHHQIVSARSNCKNYLENEARSLAANYNTVLQRLNYWVRNDRVFENTSAAEKHKQLRINTCPYRNLQFRLVTSKEWHLKTTGRSNTEKSHCTSDMQRQP
jgi:hypothetical protein